MSWFAFNIDEYDADTMHLTLAQDGAYMRLLRFYYKTRLPLPDNDHALANIARTSIEEWDTMKTVLRAFFKSRRGRLHSKRADRELDREDSLAIKRSEKAKNAAEKRHKKPRAYVLRADIEHVPSKDTVMLGDATRPDQTRQKKEEPPASLPPEGDEPKKARGYRLPSDFKVSAEWVSEGEELRRQRGLPPADLDTEAIAFPLYWTAVPGAKGTKMDWRKTWLNRCLQIKGSTNGYANGRTDGSGGIPPIQPIQPSGPRSPPPRYILPPQ